MFTLFHKFCLYFSTIMVTWNHPQPLQRLEMQIQTIISSSNCYSLRGRTTSNPGILHCHRKLQIVIPPTSNQKCQLTKVHFIVRVQRCIQPCRCWRTASLRVTRLTSKMTSFTLGKRIRIQCGNVFGGSVNFSKHENYTEKLESWILNK